MEVIIIESLRGKRQSSEFSAEPSIGLYDAEGPAFRPTFCILIWSKVLKKNNSGLRNLSRISHIQEMASTAGSLWQGRASCAQGRI